MLQVVFREHAAATVPKKFLSLFPGLGYAAGYKILQRVYKCVPLLPPALAVLIVCPAGRFGGQPYFNDFLNNNYKSKFTNAFGEKNGKALMQATAGS